MTQASSTTCADVYCLPAVVAATNVSLKVEGSAKLLVVKCFDKQILDVNMAEVKRNKPKAKTKKLSGGDDGDVDDDDGLDDLEDDLGRIMSEFWTEEEKHVTKTLNQLDRPTNRSRIDKAESYKARIDGAAKAHLTDDEIDVLAVQIMSSANEPGGRGVKRTTEAVLNTAWRHSQNTMMKNEAHVEAVITLWGNRSVESVEALTMALENRRTCVLGGVPRSAHNKREISLLMRTLTTQCEDAHLELTKLTYVQWSKVHELKGRPLDMDQGKYVKCPVYYIVPETSFREYEPIIKATGTFVSAIKNDRSTLEGWVQVVHDVYQTSLDHGTVDPSKSIHSKCILCDWDSSTLPDYEVREQEQLGVKLHKCPMCRINMHKKCAYDLRRSPMGNAALSARGKPPLEADIFPHCIQQSRSVPSSGSSTSNPTEHEEPGAALLGRLLSFIVFVSSTACQILYSLYAMQP